MNVIGVLTLLALAAPTFGVYASVVAQLAAQVTALIAMSIRIGVTPPELAVALEALVSLDLGLAIAIDLDVPSLNVEFGVSFSASLAIMIGIVAVLQLAVSAGTAAGAEVQVMTYKGAGLALGGAVSAGLGFAWPDGTPSSSKVTAVVLGATSAPAIAALVGFADGTPFATGITVAGSVGLAAVFAANFALLISLLGEFKARVSAALKANAQIGFMPPSCAASATLVANATAKVRAAIALGMAAISAKFLASIEAQIAIIASLVAKIQAQLSFATEGFDVMTYTGPGSGLGPALTSQLAGGWPDGAPGGQQSAALVLVATTPAATAALSTFFPPVAA